MNSQRLPALFLFLTLFAAPAAYADETQDIEKAEQEEARKQEAFKAGVASIVNDLNQHYFDGFVRAIDQADMVDRIYGLRLIDQRVKKGFAESLENSFGALVQSGAGIARAGIVPAWGAPDEGPRYTLLGVESRGDLGRAVVRIDLKSHQFNYQQYDLRLNDRGQVIVVAQVAGFSERH
jgi:hypothetical protein